MIRKILLLLILINSNSILGQDPKGKWSLVKAPDVFMDIPAQIIEITKNHLNTYSFDSLVYSDSVNINLTQNLIEITEKESEFMYQIIDTLFLSREIKYRHNGEDDIKTEYWDYVKLLPTQINYSIDSIIKKQYAIVYQKGFLTPHDRISFTGLLCEGLAMTLIGKENCPRYRLEKVDDTYFIVYYSDENYRKWIFPIKEINQDCLIIYGVTGQKGFMKIHEIKAIDKTSNFFIPD